MHAGVVLLNFGEPPEPDPSTVRDYLERIFLANADLDADADLDDVLDRSRRLAERRAPGLLEEYEAIGGSPLNDQSFGHAAALEEALAARGHDAVVYVGMQFTEPTIDDAVRHARNDGVGRLVGVTGYPLCGPSTTVAALESMAAAIDDSGWEVPRHEVTGWHRHPAYNRLRAENVRTFLAGVDVDIAEDGTALVFSAHGTPLKYVEAGSRYVEYVEEYCAAQASLLGVEDYAIGYQNHGNRDIEWTTPEVESVVTGAAADRVVVEPVSFMHEQSETLAELDIELREEAEAAGKRLDRVPIPHDDDRYVDVLADVVEPAVAGLDPGYYNLRPCACRATPAAVCLNAPATE